MKGAVVNETRYARCPRCQAVVQFNVNDATAQCQKCKVMIKIKK